MKTIAIACITCNEETQEALYNSDFLPNLAIMLSAFIVLALIVAILTFLSNKRFKKQSAIDPNVILLNPVPLTTTSIILGIGLGGFIDGIFLHQILQWHGMLTNKLPPLTVVAKSVNMFWDGIFHLFTLAVVIIGVVSLTRLLNRKWINPSPKLLWGGFLVGWGIFNIVEGIIDHHILDLHNIFENSQNQALYNYLFLGISVILLSIGLWVVNNRSHFTTRVEKKI